MKNLIFFFLLVATSTTFAQNYNEFIVISNNGLNLRSTPSTTSKIVTVIPFLDTLKLVNSQSFGLDTFAERRIRYSKNTLKPIICGHWRRVSYKKYSGYINDAFLFPNVRPRKFQTKESKYGLNFPSSNCYANLHRNKNLSWYAVFKNNNKSNLKRVEVLYGVTTYPKNPFDGTFNLVTSINEEDELLFLIGSEDALLEGEIRTDYIKEAINFSEEPIYHNDFKFRTLLNNNKPFLEISIGNKKQILNPKELNLSYPVALMWSGDVDKDGLTDFIIHYGEKNGQSVLYLSSEASRNNIVKAVAIFFSGYCC